MDRPEFNSKMEHAITQNQRVTNYLNTNINHIVATEIQPNLGNKVKEQMKTEVLTINQRIKNHQEVFQHRLEKRELDKKRLKETLTKIGQKQTQISDIL